MDKTAIKNFAVWARRKLISDITYKAGLIGIGEQEILHPLSTSTDNVQFFDIGTGKPTKISGHEIGQRNAFIRRINEKESMSDYKTAFQYIIEEVAYTWFNRLIAIRFMEVNDYLPSRVRVLSSETKGKSEPDMVTTPFDTDMEFSPYEQERIIQLKDENKLDELFRMLFIKQCNKLNEVLPELFEETSDYTELLLNISFTDKDGIVSRLVNEIAEENFTEAVEIIGWMYQYYNTEPKEEVFSLLEKKVKVTKERIPAATQLFTPDWIVRYMVENSLGRLWIEGHPDESLKAGWKYYLEESEQEEEVKVELEEIRIEYKNMSVEDIKIIDPCMGSGHILVYAFDILMQIYESQGYTQRDAAGSIVRNNLYGLDIDDRAYQLAYFAVMMKARKYDRRFLIRGISPKLYSIKESNNIKKSHLQYFGNSLDEAERNTAVQQMEYLLDVYYDAKEYGSILNIDDCDWDLLNRFVDDYSIEGQISLESVGSDESQKRLKDIIEVAEIMAKEYDVVVTNPPYMGKKSINSKLNKFLSDHYPLSKQDLYGTFIDKCLKLTSERGISSLITMQSWMFLTSYKGLRENISNHNSIINMVHLGAGAFEELNAFNVLTTSFCIRKKKIKNNQALFIRLVDYYKSNVKAQEFFNEKNYYVFKQDLFSQIPGTPFVYWISKEARAAFTDSVYIKDISGPKQGLATGNNNKFIRLWHEVSFNKIGQSFKNTEEFHKSGKKYAPYNKGGDYRKWYGNFDNVIMFDTEHFNTLSKMGNHLPSRQYYFKKGITWSLFGFENFGVRYKDYGCVFDVSGSSMFPEDKDTYYILGFLASKVAFMYLSILAPTVNFQVGNIADLPLKISEEKRSRITQNVRKCIEISKEDWDRTEKSWDFEKNELIEHKTNNSVEDTIESYCKYWEDRLQTFLNCEISINQDFIEIYNLQKDLAPEIEVRDISILKDTFIIHEDYSIEAKKIEIIKSFISYGVGCMFGRYSLDEDGLAYAGGDWDKCFCEAGKYTAFVPDNDNVIPINDEEYFKDDIVGLFVAFVKKVYGEETIEENLDFIANVLGNKGDTSREVIRNYFLKDFIKDHIKTYKKRPIYWLYDSGRQDGFKALIYMHRYNADTTGIVRVNYLHKMQKIYMNEIERMQDMVDNSTNSRETAKSEKRKEKLIKQLKETKEYDEKIAHIALSRIDIDLDDGFKVNYEKVQTSQDGKKFNILAKI